MLIWLLRSPKHDFKTIADFRRDYHAAFRSVFREFALTRCNNPRGRRVAGRLSSAARRGRCRGRRNGRRRAREATLLKIYVYGYLNRVQSRPRTDFAQDRAKQGKITQARRCPPRYRAHTGEVMSGRAWLLIDCKTVTSAGTI